MAVSSERSPRNSDVSFSLSLADDPDSRDSSCQGQEWSGLVWSGLVWSGLVSGHHAMMALVTALAEPSLDGSHLLRSSGSVAPSPVQRT